MSQWLHFIGKGYYTMSNFVSEAKRLGVSRKVDIRLLGGMDWGDRIWLAQGDMRKSTRVNSFNGSTVFGYFVIEQVAFDVDVREICPDAEEVEIEQMTVERGCGSYTITGIYNVKESIADLAHRARAAGGRTALLQGKIVELDPRIALPDIGFRWGFRHIDDAFYGYAMQEYEEQVEAGTYKPGTPITVTGDYGTSPDIAPDPCGGVVVQLGTYKSGDLWGEMSSDTPVN